MSDPVSNVEIEDVLSSIRRLVSEETRTGQRPNREQPAALDGRLVLTPALRVAEFPVSEPEPEPDPEPEAEATAGAEVLVMGAPLVETQRQVSEESDGSDSATEHAIEPAYDTGHDQVQEPAWEPESDIPDAMDDDARTDAETDVGLGNAVAEEPWQDPNATLFGAARSIPGDLPESAEAVWDAVEGVDAVPGETGNDIPVEDDASDGFAGNDWMQPVEPRAEQEDVPQAGENNPFGFIDTAEAVEIDEETTGTEEDRTATLSAKIEALEATIGQTQDQWEPDGGVGDDYAGTQVETIEWQDLEKEGTEVVPEPAEPAPAPEPETEAEESDALEMLAADDTFLDEESLRELVSEIVRQELQGALGERITRNVRRLVRREIHRALTAQELD